MKLTMKAVKETIDHAATINAQIKRLEVELEANKDILKDWYDGLEKPEKVYLGNTGKVTFVKEDVFADLDPKKVEEKVGERFYEVITVGVTKLKEVLSGAEVAELRGPATGKKIKILLKVI